MRTRILREIELTKIAAVDEPCQEPAKAAILKSARPYTAAQRAEMADRGWAMPDGAHPIADHRDLMASLASCASGGANDAAKAHITSRAKALGAENELPAGWAGMDDEEGDDDMGEDFTAKVAAIMKRDGCTRTEALSLAADENPAQLEKYRQGPASDAASVEKARRKLSAPPLDSEAVAKRVARTAFLDEVHKYAKARDCRRDVALQNVRKGRPDLFEAAYG
jgi:hypothetical protein